MKKIFLCLLIILLGANAHAETITLKSGRVLEGRVVERTGEYLKFKTGSGILNIRYRMMSPEDAERLKGQASPKREKKSSRPEKDMLKKKTATDTEPQKPPDIYALLEEKIAPRDYVFNRTGFMPEDYRQVIKELRDIPSNRPLLNIAKAYYYLNEDEAAIATALKAVEGNPESAEAYFTLGFISWGNDNLTHAIRYYKKAVMLNPDLAYGQIGDIYRAMDRCQEALDFYEEFRAAHPGEFKGTFGVYHSMGRCATMLGHFDEAIEYFVKSLERKDDYAQVHIDLGYSLRLVKNYEKSVQAFHKGLELDRNNYYALKGLGDSYYDLDQTEKALQIYRKAVGIHPDIEVLSRLVKTLARQGEFEECLNYLDQAEVLEPLNPAIFQGKARYLLYLERFNEAKKNYQKAVDIYRYQGDLERVVLLKQSIKAVERIERRNPRNLAPR